MLLLFETPAGYSLFKVKDEKKLQDAEVRATRGRRRTRRDATRRESGEKARAIDAAAVGRATRARAAVDDAGRARREGRGRSWTRDDAREDARAGARGRRARVDSRGNWRIGDWRATRERTGRGARTRAS